MEMGLEWEEFSVPVRKLKPKQKFVHQTGSQWADQAYSIGTFIYTSSCSSLVEIWEDGRLIRCRWQPDAPVVPINPERTYTMPPDPKAANLKGRYKVNVNLLKTDGGGTDEAKETAKQRLPKILGEAKTMKLALPMPPDDVLSGHPEIFADYMELFEAAPTDAPATQGEVNAAQDAVVTKAKAAETKKTESKPRIAPKKKEPHPCLCGCGRMTNATFFPGDDAKLKSLILKIERGDEPMDKIPEHLRDKIKFKEHERITVKAKSKDGVDSSYMTYVCVEAPVKLPAR